LSPSTNNQTEASPTPIPEFGITIAEPEAGQVVVESPTLITGITKPGARVVASTEDEDFITTADADGGFEIEVELEGGINNVLIASIDDGGKIATTQLTIAHSTELEFEGETADSEESTDSSDTVRDRLQQARSVPRFYMGTVTDIAESTIQLRNASGEIEQVSATQGETTYVTLVNDREEIEFSDIAIGDFMVAMGFVNSNGVLGAQRVLITTPPGDIERVVVSGEIISISTGEVVIKTQGEEEITLDFPRTWKGPDLDELTEGEILIAIGVADDNVLPVRSIFKAQE
jgi:hypothetical protein